MPEKIFVRSGSTVQEVIDQLGEHIAGGLDPATPVIGYDQITATRLETEPIMLDLDALMPRVIAWVTLAGKKWPIYHPQSMPAADLTRMLADQSRIGDMTDEEKEAFIDEKISTLSIKRTWNADGTVTVEPGLTRELIGPLPFEAKSKLYLAMTGVDARSASPALASIEAKHAEPTADPQPGQSN